VTDVRLFLQGNSMACRLDGSHERIIRTISGLVTFLPSLVVHNRRSKFATQTATMVYSSVVLADQFIDNLRVGAAIKSELARAYISAFENDIDPALRLAQGFSDPAALLLPATMFDYAGRMCRGRSGCERLTSALHSLLEAGHAEFRAETSGQALHACEKVGACSAEVILQAACIDHQQVDPTDAKAINLLGSIMNIVDDIQDWPADLQKGLKTMVTIADDPTTGEQIGYRRCCRLFSELDNVTLRNRMNNYRSAIGLWWLRNSFVGRTLTWSDFTLVRGP
jgi:hypothetical protein